MKRSVDTVLLGGILQQLAKFAAIGQTPELNVAFLCVTAAFSGHFFFIFFLAPSQDQPIFGVDNILFACARSDVYLCNGLLLYMTVLLMLTMRV